MLCTHAMSESCVEIILIGINEIFVTNNLEQIHNTFLLE